MYNYDGGEMRKDLTQALLDFVIDEAVAGSKRLRKMDKAVAEAQRQLRRLADDEAWAAYLDLEDAVNLRAEKRIELAFLRAIEVMRIRI